MNFQQQATGHPQRQVCPAASALPGKAKPRLPAAVDYSTLIHIGTLTPDSRGGRRLRQQRPHGSTRGRPAMAVARGSLFPYLLSFTVVFRGRVVNGSVARYVPMILRFMRETPRITPVWTSPGLKLLRRTCIAGTGAEFQVTGENGGPCAQQRIVIELERG